MKFEGRASRRLSVMAKTGEFFSGEFLDMLLPDALHCADADRLPELRCGGDCGPCLHGLRCGVEEMRLRRVKKFGRKRSRLFLDLFVRLW